jgi:hypothetical protein
MLAKRQHRKATRVVRPGATQRLTEALESLTRQDARAAATVTVAELCRVADVSRNSLYRYHAPILKALREHRRHGPQVAYIKARKSAANRRTENLALRENIGKLVALTDHYFTAYRETAALLERRERELAELRSKLPSELRVIPRPPSPR